MSTIPLSTVAIRQALQAMPAHPLTRQIEIRVLAETGSTNADLLAQLDHLHGPSMLLAENQFAGRGRAGRAWHSSAAQSLTFSLAWPCRLRLQEMLGLPLACGVAIARCLSELGVKVQLKWPNDVLKDGKKLAGILLESASHASQDDLNWAVIGIGLNLQVSAELEQKIGKPIADAPWLAQLDRNILAAQLLHHLSSCLEQFCDAGWPSFIAEWQALHAFAGQQVVILDDGKVLHQGLASGVDELGRLILETDQGRVAVLAGDVSLRSQQQFLQGDR